MGQWRMSPSNGMPRQIEGGPMNKLTMVLLASSAIAVVASAPGMAAVHMVGSNNNALVLENGSTHNKTTFNKSPYNTKTYTNVTSTSNRTYTGHKSTLYKKKVDLGHVGWLTYTNGKTVCHSIPGQKAKASKDKNAKIKGKLVQTFVSGSKCKGTVSQFDVNYELKNKKVAQDKFVFTVTKKKWTTTALLARCFGGAKYVIAIR